ncbi:MAG: hypothetical protein JXR94_17540 [Candidatus Hydrogenedentes bacterium]|nr:hypothetical protein [Candidatus Hydrogenedentota bacterium]
MKALAERLLDRISVKTLRRLMGVLLIAAAIGAVAALDFDVFRGPVPRFGGHEVAEWHLLPGGRVRVHSRITLTSSPTNATFMRIELPYESAQVESAFLNGQPVSCVEFPPGVEMEPGTYIALNTSGPGLRHDLVTVTWTFPFADLPRNEEKDYYRIRLRGLIPVKSYALVAVLEDGCGLESRVPGLRVQQPFGGTFKTYQHSIGTCGLLIRPTQQG